MILHTRVLGPGVRTAIWFQGCEKRCKGCMSLSTRDINGGVEVDVEKVYEEVAKLTDIEGITISGGEPFLQSEALYELLDKVKTFTELSVIVYTGYTIEELRLQNDERIDRILNGMIDILIDGEYVEELNDGGSLKGSSNQRVHFLTERYLSQKELYETHSRKAEIFPAERGLFLIGVPDKDTLERFRKL